MDSRWFSSTLPKFNIKKTPKNEIKTRKPIKYKVLDSKFAEN